MAIAYDTYTDGASNTSYSHTCTGSNLILLVSVGVLTGNTPTVTYNGVSMTQLTSTASSIGFTFFTFYLLNPATGSNTVSLSSTGALKGSFAISYTGVRQVAFPDSFSNTAATASPCTVTSTALASNCWTVGIGWTTCTSAPSATISDDKTSRGTSSPVDNSPNWKYDVCDSNGVVSAGSNSIAFTTGGGGTVRGNGTIISLSPVTTSGIQVDTVSNSQGSGTSLTFAHVCNGSNGLLVVGFFITRALTSVTYNGVSMTSGASLTNGSGTVALYYLQSPSTGSNNITITIDSSGDIGASAVSFYNAGGVGNNTTNSGTGITSLSTNLTTAKINSYIAQLEYKQASTGITQSSGQVEYGDQDTAIGDRTAGAFKFFASTGSQAMNYSGAGSSASLMTALLEIQDYVPPATNANFLQFMR